MCTVPGLSRPEDNDGGTITLVASGRIRHRQLRPGQVEAALRRQFYRLTVSGLDFTVERGHCKVEFFCNELDFLDYTVTPNRTGAAPALTSVLAREANSLNEILTKALSKPFRSAKVEFCRIEDDSAEGQLLSWVKESPLKSRPAILSYGVFVTLVILAIALVRSAYHQHPSVDRNNNIVAIWLATCIPAGLLLLPFFAEHIILRKIGRWAFTQNRER